MNKKIYFITGTDTGVGKTVATAALGLLLQKEGLSVGVMKPVQCSGNDARLLKRLLNLKDTLDVINPCYAPQPLSPHLAFTLAGRKVDRQKIFDAFHVLKSRYDILLIEGAGGLMVPLFENYFVADLARDLGAEIIIVARTGLGTINHTLLTIREAKSRGIGIKGLLFSETQTTTSTAKKTNPGELAKLTGLPVIGVIPFLKQITAAHILKQVNRRLNLKPLLSSKRSARRTQQLQKLDQDYVWHPFTQMKDWSKDDPLVIERAQGVYLMDTDGRSYLDGVSSLWVNVHGHRKDAIDQALRDQLNRVAHTTFLGLSNEPAVLLAEQLIKIAPKGLNKVFYSDNGSTAVEIAIKMAYQYWQNNGQPKKTDIVHLTNSYHGDTLGSVSVGGIDLFHKTYRKLIFKTIALPAHGWVALEAFERLLKKRSQTIAALIVEPMIQAAAGMLIWPKGVLKAFRQLCRRYNVFLIADEVATGFGRTGKMFACEHESVTPDFLCLAKGLTGGYLPLAATLTSQKVFDGFLFDYKDQKTFFHGHTYTANLLACAAAVANLEIFDKEQVIKKLGAKIKYLAQRLQMFYNLASVGEIRQLGFMVGIELVRDRKTHKPFLWHEKVGVRVCQQARQRGVILRPLGNVIVLMPPLSITKNELDVLIQATYQSIEFVTNQ